ncbi:MAG: inositol monophosphatase [Desulfobacterales bacterium]|nr:inositol monophosphatase [Desulfobacterales bacterium]
MDLQQVKRIAVAAAFSGGRILLSHFGNRFRIEKKSANDLVTEADIASERIIVDIIGKTFPSHTIVAEESGVRPGSEIFSWLIDPLDGTTNFAHGIGIFAISIAFVRQGIPVVGVVLNPITGELFSAVTNQGATLNGRPISVSQTDCLADGLLATGFPYNLKEIRDPLMRRLSRGLDASRGVRRLGAAALDLCFLACGRFDGFWEQNLKPWDTAAGTVIACEAGARVTDFNDHPFRVTGDCILATNGRIHTEMINLMNLDKRP